MDNVISIDAARALVADAALWPHVRDFLWNFASQVHESWIADIKVSEKVDTSFVSHVASSSRVKAWMLEKLGVEPCFHDFPKNDWSRLALLEGATLLEMTKWLGALVCAEHLRMVTDGVSVRGLKGALPGVYPDVFTFTAYFSGLRNMKVASRGDDDTHRLADCVMAAGSEILLSLVSAAPAHVVARMKLKFPKGSPFTSLASGNPSTWRGAKDSRRDGLDSDFARLLKLKFPEAYSLCC